MTSRLQDKDEGHQVKQELMDSVGSQGGLELTQHRTGLIDGFGAGRIDQRF
ncbi:hypothetical protein O7A70_23875 [Mesorhizobium sp. Cs1299R1N1]|uniref:hypothetical protein n=1 Tax=Mesorhizobium sp. Cs1299R1N1 TaxID=3015172 RepID=UPI00301BC738